jgi:hypothetical protein
MGLVFRLPHTRMPSPPSPKQQAARFHKSWQKRLADRGPCRLEPKTCPSAESYTVTEYTGVSAELDGAAAWSQGWARAACCCGSRRTTSRTSVQPSVSPRDVQSVAGWFVSRSGGAQRAGILMSGRVCRRDFTGVDFKLKFMPVGDKKLKLTIWDTGAWVSLRQLLDVA